MLETEDVIKLVEANKIMSSLIDRLVLLLFQHMTFDEMDEEILLHAKKAAGIMKDYE